ncbi:MAG: flagellar basal body-associated FliL family protein [Vicinamibacterales bacterium]
MSEHGLVKFEPFIVNLADEGSKWFLKVSIQLVVDTPKEAAEFEEKPVLSMGARLAIVDLLSEQTSEHLASPEGKTKLREELKEAVSKSPRGRDRGGGCPLLRLRDPVPNGPGPSRCRHPLDAGREGARRA